MNGSRTFVARAVAPASPRGRPPVPAAHASYDGGVAVALTALAAIAAVAAVAAAWALRARRAAARHLVAVAARLDGGALPHRTPSLPAVVHRLDLAVADAGARVVAAGEQLARCREALERVSEAVVVCDAAGEIVFSNGLASTYLGGRRADALAEQQIRRLLDVALEGESSTVDLDLFGPPRRTLVLRAFPLDDGERLVGAAVVIDDVSERRRVEAMRRDFVANISHELKTPIGALGLLAETLADEEDVAVLHRLAARLHAEAFRVGRIIDDLLDLSRIEAEEAPSREPVAVDVVVGQAVERVRGAAEARAIAVDAADVPRGLHVVGDRRQLVSAVFNLLENAVKYSEPGSSVELRVRAEGRTVDIEVRDHGIGIPSRDLERIFERFYRVDRARSRDTGGTGLGLAIVRHVAANHGGEVHVDSREGEGSTFVLRLPAGVIPATFGAEAS